MSVWSATTGVPFGASLMKPLVAQFDQSRSGVDVGAVLLCLLDAHRGIAEVLAGAVSQSRGASRVQRSRLELVR